MLRLRLIFFFDYAAYAAEAAAVFRRRHFRGCRCRHVATMPRYFDDYAADAALMLF